jgi:hypothetical protein
MFFGLKFSRKEGNKLRSHWSKFSNSNAYESLRDRYWCEVEGVLIAKLRRDRYPLGLKFYNKQQTCCFSHSFPITHRFSGRRAWESTNFVSVTCTHSHLRALCCYSMRMKHAGSCTLLSHSQLGFCS